jgi:hypothetical protein
VCTYSLSGQPFILLQLHTDVHPSKQTTSETNESSATAEPNAGTLVVERDECRYAGRSGADAWSWVFEIECSRTPEKKLPNP